MQTRLFDEDPLTGTRRLFHFDPVTEQATIETIHNAEPVVEQNKWLANAQDSNWKGDWHHVASIPMVIYFDLKKKGILDDPKAFRKWLNDRDNLLFRTKPGKV